MELLPVEEDPVPPSLTSTTAPGKSFSSRSDLQSHYKSDWHRYNLKRREAGLPMLNETDFNLRLEAAIALRKEREGREERSGVDHRKDKQKGKKERRSKQKGKQHKRQPAHDRREADEPMDEEGTPVVEDVADEDSDMDEAPPEINPSQCPFDAHVSPTPQGNLAYMQQKYSFYLPDAEYCTDLEGFLGYCNEKVRWGNMCLYCQKSFGDAEGTVKHMQDKRHCKILYERGVDQEEYDVFYDFSDANREFLGEEKVEAKGAVEEGDEEEWEDVDDDEGEWEDASMQDTEDDDLYAAYESELNTHGFDVTPLGELIFPDGRIVGHRGLARYYKQRFAPDRTERAAVRHAREAAGDRLYAGRVVNLHRLQNEANANTGAGGEGSAALATVGRRAGAVPTGRGGNGILVAGGDRGGFTSLSLYRYRAAVKKQRREDAKGQRLQYRSRMNMNKMDKKGNTRATGVVTALNPR